MGKTACIAGVGMIPFAKPGKSDPYDRMGEAAARLALEDAGIEYRDLEQAYVGFVYGDTTSGQQALYRVSVTGIPIFNVNNACATGSTALYLARQAIEMGVADIVLALGFEQMVPGALDFVFRDRPPILGKHDEVLRDATPDGDGIPFAARYFGAAGREHQRLYGTRDDTFARITVKARRHAANNPLALFRDPLTVEEVLASAPVYGPMTRFQCCPPTCGAAAAIVMSDSEARRRGITSPVTIAGQALTTDHAASFDGASMIRLVGSGMTGTAAQQVYAQAGVGPRDLDVVELHDCFTSNELITYEALGLAEPGGGERFVCDGDNSYGGAVVTNPSGGLLAKGHPLGATGLAQCAELVWQLRGQAGARQVDGARTALQHNIGLGGACVVTLYQRG